MSQTQYHHGNLTFEVLLECGCSLRSCTQWDASQILLLFLCELPLEPPLLLYHKPCQDLLLLLRASGNPITNIQTTNTSLPLGNSEHMLLSSKIQKNMLKLP